MPRYLRRLGRRGDPPKRWRAFLQNRREVIVAFDSFTMPTVTFQLLYCFCHRAQPPENPHFYVTRRPTSDWLIQEWRETFPEAALYRYVILDRDVKFDHVARSAANTVMLDRIMPHEPCV